MKKNTSFSVGDLVTYTKDLLGVEGYSGIVTSVFKDDDGVCFCLIKWDDGCHYPEMFKHIRLLAKAIDKSNK
jgi:hypothetical protein|tara:strand:+ start:858 stop:1073 length:216 start_codon:yes stop_codon:yes gene_type:complete